jgi:hypothetical protein
VALRVDGAMSARRAPFAAFLVALCSGIHSANAQQSPPGIAPTNGPALGVGVQVREPPDARGNDVAIALAGWRITAESTQAWLTALYEARLRAMGVRRLYAVRGPVHVDYRGHEIATRAIADDLARHVTAHPEARVLVVSHSSGAHVAAELFHRIFRERNDHGASLRNRILFVSLDGDPDVASDRTRSLAPDTVAALRHAWFVTARDSVHNLDALSNGTMRAQQRRYPAQSDFVLYDARDAGCTARICVHLSLVNAHPSARGNDSYARYPVDGAPNTSWLAGPASRWAR